MSAGNRHATGVILGDRGVLITGASGSGKTGLALALMDHARRDGRHAALIGDDQLFLRGRSGRLIASAPASIAGLVEVRGLGPRPAVSEPDAVVDLLVRLVPRGEMVRFQEAATEEIEGCRLPRLDLAAHDPVAAVMAVAARLYLPPFA